MPRYPTTCSDSVGQSVSNGGARTALPGPWMMCSISVGNCLLLF